MRDCIFLLADSHMQAAFASFLSLEHKAQKLGSGPFRFNVESDLIVAGNDPAVYRRGPDLLRPYRSTHRFAVLALDFAFEHRLTAQELVEELLQRMQCVGWEPSRCEVVLIVPELEQWLWQNDPAVQQEVFWRDLSPAERADLPSLRLWLQGQSDGDGSLWPAGQPKPRDPKTAMLRAMGSFRQKSPPAVFTEVFRRVSVARCQDPAFLCLRSALRRWFPPVVNSNEVQA